MLWLPHLVKRLTMPQQDLRLRKLVGLHMLCRKVGCKAVTVHYLVSDMSVAFPESSFLLEPILC